MQEKIKIVKTAGLFSNRTDPPFALSGGCKVLNQASRFGINYFFSPPYANHKFSAGNRRWAAASNESRSRLALPSGDGHSALTFVRCNPLSRYSHAMPARYTEDLV